MSGFLQRLLERTHGATQAPLRRRRPSLFEGHEAAPPPALANAAAPAVPAPALPDSAPRVLHTREIHHHDSAAAPIARHVPSAENVAAPVPKPATVGSALPMPPSLRPLPASPAPQAKAPVVAASIEVTKASTTQRARHQPEPTPLAGPVPSTAAAIAANNAPPLRRTRPAPAPAAEANAPSQALPLPPRLAASPRAAAPVAHPARRAALPAPAAAPVQVSIGSVEIRAQAAAPTPERMRARPSPTPQVPSLDAYLRERHGGPR